MATFLFVWNPKRWLWPDLECDQKHLRENGFTIKRWSCGNRKRIHIGDRAFLIRLVQEPKGLFGSGVIVRERYDDEHYDLERAKVGDRAGYVDIRFDVLCNPERDDILPYQILIQDQTLKQMHWGSQASGIEISEDVAWQLERIWDEITHDMEQESLPEEINDPDPLVEGAKRRIYVNSYERNPEARSRCITHFGAQCIVCGFDFGAIYGPVGVGFIHVHHLRALADVGAEYKVDPVADLRPVCPNCHAIIHRRSPPYKIGDVRRFLSMKK